MSPSPQRILFLRPDAYGDLFLFEPVPRLVRHAWPQAEVAVLIRQPYADVVPLLEWDGVHVLTTDCNPYREGPGDQRAALANLRDTVRAFAPDCVVAACTEQTWLESAVAAFLPGVRQISLGHGLTDPASRAALEREMPVDWAAIYPEKVLLDPEMPEWEKNLRLAGALLGHEAPRWWPSARTPEAAREQAAQVLAASGLVSGEFVACAAAGTANVQIKSWPAAHYGETLAWLEREHGVRALLIGHVAEREHLEAVCQTARAGGAAPALWLGQAGEMPVVAGLLAAARFYFGNDTGALHLAASLGRPVVSVFGGGHWPRFAPVARRSVTVVQPLPCFGCQWDCYFVDAPCVRTISTRFVRHALEQFLATDTENVGIYEAEGLEAGVRTLIDKTTPRLRFQRADSVDRLRQINELTAQLTGSETDRDARGSQVTELTALLQTSEADCTARTSQLEELTALLQTSEADRDARQRQIEELTPLLRASEADRAARQRQIEELTPLLRASEADRDARQDQIEELTALLRASEADRAARQRQIEELTPLLRASEADRDTRGKQIEQLTAWLKTSEADRATLARQLEGLTVSLPTGETGHPAPGELLEESAQPMETTATSTRESREPAGALTG